MMLCVRHRLCLSFNHDDVSGMCQLNNARKEEFPASYKPDDSFNYFDRVVSRVYGSVESTTEATQQVGAAHLKDILKVEYGAPECHLIY